MKTTNQPTSNSSAQLWTGRVISALVILFMVFDGVIKLMKITPVVEAFAHLGYPMSCAVSIGLLGLACTALYAFPSTSVLGAILLTGYLGGATAAHVRIGDPLYFSVIFGILVWLGLYLRDGRVRAFLPVWR